eukprot:scaffold156167_cov32-Prasinocladus_malaysianus.AAC.1
MKQTGRAPAPPSLAYARPGEAALGSVSLATFYSRGSRKSELQTAVWRAGGLPAACLLGWSPALAGVGEQSTQSTLITT